MGRSRRASSIFSADSLCPPILRMSMFIRPSRRQRFWSCSRQTRSNSVPSCCRRSGSWLRRQAQLLENRISMSGAVAMAYEKSLEPDSSRITTKHETMRKLKFDCNGVFRGRRGAKFSRSLLLGDVGGLGTRNALHNTHFLGKIARNGFGVLCRLVSTNP